MPRAVCKFGSRWRARALRAMLWSPLLRRLSFWLAVTPLVLAILLLGSRVTARAFLFPVRAVPTIEVPPDVTVHALVARDGVAVRALELPAPPGARTLVDFHNNRETAESRIDMARALRGRGLGVLLVEYR